MQAAVLWEQGKPLEVRDVELVGPGPGEIRVRVAASGVCHSDLSLQQGVLPLPWLPGVLGHEAAGEIIAVGESVDNLGVGDHVILTFTPPDGTCRFCLIGKPNLCEGVSLEAPPPNPFRVDGEAIYSSLMLGSFAEETVVPGRAAIRIPEVVPLDVAALIGCGVTTGVGAVFNTAQVRPGSSVAVIGCGGVGIAVIQGARVAGAAEIVAIDTADQKLEWARQFGATHTSRPEEAVPLIHELTRWTGCDYVFDVVGLSSTVRQAFDITRRGGTIIVLGVGPLDDHIQFSAEVGHRLSLALSIRGPIGLPRTA